MRRTPVMSMPCGPMSRLSFALLLWLLAGCAGVEPVAVQITNASRPTRCAEEDNVYVRLAGAGVRRFTVKAQHPPYIGALRVDSTAPDFTSCNMSGDPSFPGTPRAVVLHTDAEWQLVGYAFTGFWRPATVPVRVGTRREEGLHLLQLFRTIDGTRIEFLVLYPPDGYWRARPMPPPHLGESAYGSSFLVGPVEEVGRPLVALRDIEYLPGSQSFRLGFERGGTGVLRVEQIDRREAVLSVSLDRAVPAFAALRSMFVAPDNNDTAEVRWLRPDGHAPGPQPVMHPLSERATEVRFGRTQLSRHNSSAPDMVFGGFGR
jgi:hypothetical protein